VANRTFAGCQRASIRGLLLVMHVIHDKKYHLPSKRPLEPGMDVGVDEVNGGGS